MKWQRYISLGGEDSPGEAAPATLSSAKVSVAQRQGIIFNYILSSI